MAWTERQCSMLEALGLGPWVRPATSDDAAAVAVEESPTVEHARPTKPGRAASDGACSACPRRMAPIEARGSAAPAWLVVGGAPPPEDAAAARAFTGAPGELLLRMLRAIGFPADGDGDAVGARLTFAVRCAPVDGRAAGAEQLAGCAAAVRAEVERLRPRVVLALGRTAAQGLLGVDDAGARRRGVVHRLGDVPVVITHELPFLLRQPEAKAEAWDDLCLALEAAGNSVAPPAP